MWEQGSGTFSLVSALESHMDHRRRQQNMDAGRLSVSVNDKNVIASWMEILSYGFLANLASELMLKFHLIVFQNYVGQTQPHVFV